jgi:hypothetical protein
VHIEGISKAWSVKYVESVLWCSGSTKDSESFNPSSNLGRTYTFVSSFFILLELNLFN